MNEIKIELRDVFQEKKISVIATGRFVSYMIKEIIKSVRMNLMNV